MSFCIRTFIASNGLPTMPPKNPVQNTKFYWLRSCIFLTQILFFYLLLLPWWSCNEMATELYVCMYGCTCSRETHFPHSEEEFQTEQPTHIRRQATCKTWASRTHQISWWSRWAALYKQVTKLYCHSYSIGYGVSCIIGIYMHTIFSDIK